MDYFNFTTILFIKKSALPYNLCREKRLLTKTYYYELCLYECVNY